MRKKQIKKITLVGILAALSVIFYIFLKFPLPFIFPSFLDIQLYNLPVILAGLIFGPAESLVVVLIRFVIKAPFTSTAYVGEVADLIINSLDRTVTEVYSTGGYSNVDTKMLICILSTKEYYSLRSIISEVDPEAFVFVTKASEVRGAGFTYDKQYK